MLQRPLVVFGLTSIFSIGVLSMTGGRHEAGRGMMEAAASSRHGAYQLARLDLLEETLAHVNESYVEPDRVNPDRMFTAALESVERLVPEAMFRREGSMLAVQVADHRTTMDIGEIEDLDQLARQLRRVAAVMESNLDASDIPDPDAYVSPYAMVEYAMANGALETLDPHSMLLPPAESKEMDVENRGEFGGLGISIQMSDGQLTVEYPMPGTPAYRAGIQAGDQLRRIDREPTVNMTIDEAVELLRGPIGAPVTLEIVRSGVEKPFDVVVERDNIKVSPVEAFPMGGGYGYARIRTFHSSAAADLRDALTAMVRAEGPVKGLILDLRDNPGGYLNQAVSVANLFMDEGEIVTTQSPHEFHASPEVADARNTQDPYPIAVLVNANSASASEIVAGALRNNERAVIVGEKTFGKGSVQNLHAIPQGSKLKITIAQYLTPGDRSIQSVGIPADIELTPAYVGSREMFGTSRPDVSLFSRERVRREADLDAHLVSGLAADDVASYVVQYHQSWDVQRPFFDAPDTARDFEVGFALALLQSTSSPHRSEALAAADRLVSRVKADNERAMVQAFGDIGIDWRRGPMPGTVDLSVSVTASDGSFDAGEDEAVVFSVTNMGDEPVYRAIGQVRDHELFDGVEFPLGFIPPGETRTFTTVLAVEAGYPNELTAVDAVVRTASGEELVQSEQRIEVLGRPLPQLAWRWRVLPTADGQVGVGGSTRLEVEVENVGLGPTVSATARIKNRSGRALDILKGTLLIGDPVDGDGQPCLPESEGCSHVLAPGATWVGTFEVELLEPLLSGYGLHLSVGDGEAFDYGAVVRSGFYSYYRQEEELSFSLGEAEPFTSRREPPQIRITRAPQLQVNRERVTLSGRASDDDGLAHIMVYAGDDKVFFQGSRAGQELRLVPFSADIELSSGRNTISVLTTDAQGFRSTTSLVVHRVAEPERVSMADPTSGELP